MKKVSYYLIYFLFIMSFFQGYMQIIGISDSITRTIIHLGILLLFLFSLVVTSFTKETFISIAFTLLIFLLISIMSFLNSSLNILELLLFLKLYFIPLLFFISILNLNLDKYYLKKILNLIIILFILQIPFTVLKILSIGFSENYIGSVSVSSGSVATILPLIAISYIIVNMENIKPIYVNTLIPMFLLVAVASNKLAMIVYLVIIIIAIYFIKNGIKGLLKISLVNKVIQASLLVGSLLYIVISYNPRFLPQRSMSTLDSALLYVENYTQRDDGLDNAKGASRLSGLEEGFKLVTSKDSLLLGLGAGNLIKSSFSRYESPALEKYGLGYGVRTGLMQFIMQIGVLGTISYLSLIFLIFKKMSIEKNTPESLFGKVFIILFLLDFFTYSTVLMKQPSMSLTFFFAMAYILLLRNNHEKKFI